MATAEGRKYEVVVPVGFMTFFRVSDGSPVAQAMTSRCERGIKRKAAEDEADHRGLSVRGSLAAARTFAEEMNKRKRLVRSSLPQWTTIIEVRLRGDLGQCFAQTYSVGHFTIWGEASDLVSNIVAEHPI